MLPGADALRSALAELDTPGPLRSRLLSAGIHFLRALSQTDKWPADTKAWSDSIWIRLSAEGSIAETVARMDAGEARAEADRLRGFCTAFGRQGGTPRGSGSA